METKSETKARGGGFVEIHATVIETFKKRVSIVVPAEEAADEESAAERMERACNDSELDATENCDDFSREIADVTIEAVGDDDNVNMKGGK